MRISMGILAKLDWENIASSAASSVVIKPALAWDTINNPRVNTNDFNTFTSIPF